MGRGFGNWDPLPLSGIKTGRYTYEKRTSDILELKRLHGKEARQRVQNRQEQLTQHFEQLIAQIVAAQERNHTDAMQTNPIINEIHKSYMEKKKQEERAAVNPGTAQAPIDPMDDKRKVMNAWITTAERGLQQMVKFAKDLPGFNSLPLPDQIMLLKNSIAEAWVITRHKAFNVDVGCYSAHCGFTFDINKVFDQDFVEALLAVVKRIQHLQLTYEETCVLKAMSFFFSDRCELTAPRKVDEMQLELVEVLTYLLHKNHPEKPRMLAHILMVMTDLRTITEMYHKHNEKVLSWTDMQRAPLICEVMSYSRTLHHRDDEDDDKTSDSSGSSDKPGELKMHTEN